MNFEYALYKKVFTPDMTTYLASLFIKFHLNLEYSLRSILFHEAPVLSISQRNKKAVCIVVVGLIDAPNQIKQSEVKRITIFQIEKLFRSNSRKALV